MNDLEIKHIEKLIEEISNKPLEEIDVWRINSSFARVFGWDTVEDSYESCFHFSGASWSPGGECYESSFDFWIPPNLKEWYNETCKEDVDDWKPLTDEDLENQYRDIAHLYYESNYESIEGYTPPNYVASIDAVLEFCNLDISYISFNRSPDGFWYAQIKYRDNVDPLYYHAAYGTAATKSLALCVAVVRALLDNHV